MVSFSPICFQCKNYIGEYKCKAFPDEIPDEILIWKFEHIKKHPDQDNDIVFEKIK